MVVVYSPISSQEGQLCFGDMQQAQQMEEAELCSLPRLVLPGHRVFSWGMEGPDQVLLKGTNWPLLLRYPALVQKVHFLLWPLPMALQESVSLLSLFLLNVSEHQILETLL